MTGFGQWAVEEQSTRRMIGQAGFFIRGQELGEDFDPFPEFGEVLVPRVQGNGYGWEAALAAHDWYDRVITGGLVTQVASDNAPALRVAWRLGYRALREIPGDGDTIVLMRRDRPIGTV